MNSSVSGGLASVPSAKDSSSTTCCGSCRSNRSTLAVQSFRILVLLRFLCFLNPIAVACCRGCKQSKKSFGRVSRSNLTQVLGEMLRLVSVESSALAMPLRNFTEMARRMVPWWKRGKGRGNDELTQRSFRSIGIHVYRFPQYLLANTLALP